MRRSHGMVLVLLLAGLQRATSDTPDTNSTAGSGREAGNGSGMGAEEPAVTTTMSAARGAGTSSPTQPGDGTQAPTYTRATPDSATSPGGIPPPGATSPGDGSRAPGATTAVTAEAPGSSQGTSGTSAAAAGSQDAHGAPDTPEKSNKGGVIFGVLLGTILGFVLFGLIGYFICGKKNSESFSHRRLYEDTSSEPALSLDTARGPHDAAFGGTGRDKTKAGDTGWPGQDMAMDDVTPARPSE